MNMKQNSSDGKYRVLLVDDSRSDARLLQELLRDAAGFSCETTHVESLADAIAALGADRYDVALLDLRLPDSDGLETLKRLHDAAPDVATVVLTGSDDTQLSMQAVTAGAQDYLVKTQIGAALVARSIRYAVERQESELRLRRSERYWRQMFDSVRSGIAIVERDGTIMHCNGFMERIAGMKAAEMTGRKCYTVMRGRAEPPDECPVVRAGRSRRRERMQFERDGRCYEAVADPIAEAGGDFSSAVITITDITEREAVARRERHLGSVLRAIRTVNQLITKVRDRQSVIDGACRALTEARRYRSCWIVLIDEEYHPTMWAESGVGDEYGLMLGRLARDGELPACAVRAINTPAVVSLTSIRELCDGCSLQHLYPTEGALCSRLAYGEHVYGIMCVVVEPELVHDAQEVELLTGLMSDLAFALHGIEQDEKREEAEARVRSFARFASENPNPLLRISHDYEVLVANEAARKLLRTLGVADADTAPAEWRAFIDLALSMNAPAETEVTCDDAVYAFTAAPVKEDRIVNFYGLDITQRKRAEEREWCNARDLGLLSRTAMDFVRLPSDQDLYQYITERIRGITGEHVAIAGCEYDAAEGVYRLRSLLGLGSDLAVAREVFGRDISGLAGKVSPSVEELLRTGKLCKVEAGIVEALGDAFPAEVAATLKEKLGLDDVYVMGFVREGRIYGAAMILPREGGAALNTSLLEAFVSQATIALERRTAEKELRAMQDQLRQAQKMEAIGVLAGGIAHDFNNILGAIVGYTDLTLEEAEEGTRTRRNLLQVKAATARATDLVRQILTFSRQSKSEKRRLDLTVIVKEALKLLRPSLPSTIEIHQRVSRTSGPIVGDPTQVHQVLMNLCTNAAHAMRGRHGTLTVSLEETELGEPDASAVDAVPAGRYMCLQVADTGMGMAPEVIERVFEPFFTTKAPGEGTGMGLAVVHGIVQDHGGRIDIESVPDAGTTVSVYLPIDTTADGEKKAEQGGEQHRGTERVLLVDDEQLLVDLGSEMLTGLGYTVAAYSDSELALQEYQADPSGFDVVVTDLTMPRLTGLQLALECKRLRPDMPIVLCTGYTDAKVPGVGVDEAVQALITKPLTRRLLGDTVREVLDARRQPEETPGGAGE